MITHERTKTILKHCMRKECFGCPLRQTRECVCSMACGAIVTITELEKRIAELEKQLAMKEGEHHDQG